MTIRQFLKDPVIANAVLGAAVVCAAAAVWRAGVYAPLEPISDQIFFIQWVRRLRFADHVLPMTEDGMSWLRALIVDEQSLLNIYLRQVYAAQQHIFTVLSVVWFYLWSFVTSPGIDGQVVISIATHALAILVLALTPLFLHMSTPRFAALVGVAVAILATLGGFLSDFSVTGAHNSGALFLFVALAVTARWIANGAFATGWRPGLVVVVAQIAAVYSFYTNVFLLLPATFLTLLFHPGSGARVRQAMRYAMIAVVMMTPALALLLAERLDIFGFPIAASFIDVGREVAISPEVVFGGLGQRAARWLTFQAAVFTPGMLLAAAAGLYMMARNEQALIYAFIVIAHLGAGVVLPGFGFYQKTSGYLLPILTLGAAYATAAAFRALAVRHAGAMRTSALAAAVLVLVGVSAMTEMSSLADVPRKSEMVGFTQRGGTLRDLFAGVDGHLRNGDVVIADHDITAQSFVAYSQRLGTGIQVFRPLDTMMAQLAGGTLKTYITRRGLTSPERRSIIVLVPPLSPDGPDAAAIKAVLGPRGLNLAAPIEFEWIGAWPTSGAFGSAAYALYRLR